MPSRWRFRVIEIIDGSSWFLAHDVCRALGVYVYSGMFNVNMADDKLAGGQRFRLTTQEANRIGLKARCQHGMMLVSESGLHKLIIRSDEPVALLFQDWVTRTVHCGRADEKLSFLDSKRPVRRGW